MSKARLRVAIRRLKHGMEHQNRLVIALWMWALFLLHETFVRTYDLYRIVPMIDVVSHFLAGIALGATFLWFAYRAKYYHTNWVSIAGVIIASLIWEGVEIVQQWVIINPPYLIDIFFWDGFFDIIFALLGTLTFLLIRTFREE